MEEKIEAGEHKAVKGADGQYENKAEWVKRFKESGLSLRKFSAEHGLGYMSLWKWVRRSEGGEGSSSDISFQEIEWPGVCGSTGWAAEVSLPNGTVLRLSREVPAAMLEQLMRLC